MRRRQTAGPSNVPPPRLRTYAGRSTREALAWIDARDQWWTVNRHPDDPRWLPFLLEGWEQVGDLKWCGSIGSPCADDDCLCQVPYSPGGPGDLP